jgi:type I restriction enzyme R subunit
MPSLFTEAHVEAAALEWFAELGYAVAYGPTISPGEPTAERVSYADVVLVGRLRDAVDRLNPALPAEVRDNAVGKVLDLASPSLIAGNRAFHRMLVEGVAVERSDEAGHLVGERVYLVDFTDPDRNDWLVVNQLTVIEARNQPRRPDLVVFVNGLPLAIFELKDATDEQATIWSAFNDHQTKLRDIPTLYQYNEVLAISDGLTARVGSLTADRERFLPWRTSDGESLAPATIPQLQVLIEGLFDRRRFLDYVNSFVVFEDEDGRLVKKIAAYHQFHAVNRAVTETVRAASIRGNRRIGVVWHTQGSGKSLTMAFYTGRLVVEPALANPTIVVLTDRNDLDDQLFGTFSRCRDLLRRYGYPPDKQERATQTVLEQAEQFGDVWLAQAM